MRETAVVEPNAIEWQPVQQLPPGAWIKVLSKDEKTGALAAIMKFDKGYCEPKHSHPSAHDIYIIDGKLVDDQGNETKTGMYFYAPAKDVHGPFTAPEGCTFFITLDGPPFE